VQLSCFRANQLLELQGTQQTSKNPYSLSYQQLIAETWVPG